MAITGTGDSDLTHTHRAPQQSLKQKHLQWEAVWKDVAEDIGVTNCKILRWGIKHRVYLKGNRVYKVQHDSLKLTLPQNQHLHYEFQILSKFKDTSVDLNPKLYLSGEWSVLEMDYITSPPLEEEINSLQLPLLKIFLALLRLSVKGIAYKQFRLRHTYMHNSRIYFIDFGGSNLVSPWSSFRVNLGLKSRFLSLVKHTVVRKLVLKPTIASNAAAAKKEITYIKSEDCSSIQEFCNQYNKKVNDNQYHVLLGEEEIHFKGVDSWNLIWCNLKNYINFSASDVYDLSGSHTWPTVFGLYEQARSVTHLLIPSSQKKIIQFFIKESELSNPVFSSELKRDQVDYEKSVGFFIDAGPADVAETFKRYSKFFKKIVIKSSKAMEEDKNCILIFKLRMGYYYLLNNENRP